MSENQYEQENGKDLRYNSEYLLHQLFLTKSLHSPRRET